MGYETTGTHPPLVREESADWSAVEPSEHSEVEREHSDIEHEQQDVEGNELRPELSRTTTGPPYTIFSKRAKLFIVASVSVAGLISPFGAVTFYPALNVLAKQLNVTPSMINIALTTYMVGTALLRLSADTLTLTRLHKLLRPRSLRACRTTAVADSRSLSALSSIS